MDTSKINASFERHRASPELSTDKYVRRRSLELGEYVAARQRIYLDKCFWIDLRDAYMGRTEEHKIHALLDGLINRVNQDQCICPISDALFLELLKQSDSNTKLATANLIDALSGGVSLIPRHQRISTEVAHFIHANSGIDTHPLELLAWSKLGYVFGITLPVPTIFPDQEKAVIQKSFFDLMWEMPLTHLVQIIGEEHSLRSIYPDIAQRLNKLNTEHATSMTSFTKVYKDEIYGSLDIAAHIAYDVIGTMFRRTGGITETIPQSERLAKIKKIHHFLCSAIKKPIAKRALRTLHIGAVLHAAIRWNRHQKLDGNDLFDFQHAEAALGYCDVFLTERPLHALLMQRHRELADNFPCRVISSVEEAASLVS